MPITVKVLSPSKISANPCAPIDSSSTCFLMISAQYMSIQTRITAASLIASKMKNKKIPLTQTFPEQTLLKNGGGREKPREGLFYTRLHKLFNTHMRQSYPAKVPLSTLIPGFLSWPFSPLVLLPTPLSPSLSPFSLLCSLSHPSLPNTSDNFLSLTQKQVPPPLWSLLHSWNPGQGISPSN